MVSRLNIALELAKHNAVYEDIASKFFEVRTFHVGGSLIFLTNVSISSLLLML